MLIKYKYKDEYRKFLNEFWWKFSRLDEKDKEILIKIWFEKVKTDLDNEELFHLHNKHDTREVWRKFFSIYLKYHNDIEWLKRFNDIFRFKEYFWNRFALTSKKWKEILLNLWFDKVKTDFDNDETYYEWSRFDLYLKYYNDNIQFKRYKEEKLFIKKYHLSFYKQTRKEKEELLNIWFDNVVKEIENEKYFEYWNFFKTYLKYRNDEEWFKRFKDEIEFKKYFWQRYNQLNSKEKDEILNLTFEKVKSDFEKEEKFYYWTKFTTYLRYKDNLEWLNKFFDDINFKHEFWNRYNLLKKEHKDKLLQIWFDKVLNDFNNNDWFYYWVWFDTYFEFKDNINWLERFIEHRKFSSYYWNRYTRTYKEDQEILLDIWFDIVKKELEENKNLSLYQWFWMYLFYKNDKEWFERYIKEIDYSKEFWNRFKRLVEEDKDEIMKIWIDEIKKDFKENKLLKRLFNSNRMWFHEYILYKKWELDLREVEFIREFWWKFSQIKYRENKEELINIWFETVKKELKKNKYLYEIYEKFSFNQYIYYREKTEEEQIYFLEHRKFSSYFWNSFSLFRRKDELIEIWFDQVMKDFKSNKLFEEYWYDFYLENRNKKKDEINREIKRIEIIELCKRNKVFINWISEKFMNILIDECPLKEIEEWLNLDWFEVYSLSWLIFNKMWHEITKNWYIIHKNCWHKEKFNWAIFQRIKRWTEVHCTQCYRLWWRWFSNQEKQVLSYIKSIYFWEIQENVCIIKNKDWLRRREIDIYLPELKIWIEYNWLYWHSSNDLTTYKIKESEKEWIQLFVIWEDQWLNRQEQVKHKIKEKLWLLRNRNLDFISIKTIDYLEFKKFHNKYDLNEINESINWVNSEIIYLWSFINWRLIWVFSFNKKWEILNFSSNIWNQSELLKNFINFIKNNFVNLKTLSLKSDNQVSDHYKYEECWFKKIWKYRKGSIYISYWERFYHINELEWKDYYEIMNSWWIIYEMIL